jgi:ABC-type enterobactin transport system permease subunit
MLDCERMISACRTGWGNTMIGAILVAVLLTVVAVAAAGYIAALALTYAVIRSESRVGMARSDQARPPED